MSLMVIIQILFFGGKEREEQKETKIQEESELMRSKQQTSTTTRVYPTSTNTLDCETGNNLPGTLMNSEIRDEDGDIESRRKSSNAFAPDTPKSSTNTKRVFITPRSASRSPRSDHSNNTRGMGNFERVSANVARKESKNKLIDRSPRESLQGCTPKRSFGGNSPRIVGNSPRIGGNSPRIGGNSPRIGGNSPRIVGNSPKIVGFGSSKFLSSRNLPLGENDTPKNSDKGSHHSSLCLDDSNVSKASSRSSKLPPMTFGYIFVVYILYIIQ